MDFQLSPEEEAFRDEVRAFIDENLPADAGDLAAIMRWNQKAREARYTGFSWPTDVGGGGGSIMEQVILKEEMAKVKAPPLGTCFMGLAWVGPSIIQYGNEKQKQQYIPDILDGAYQWCTGYSEPDSGSDLASLKCKCVRDGGEYVVNGQKIWTSIAMWSKMIILLVRTETEVEQKHDGITCLLVPMDDPGIEVRPIRNMGGGAIFAEVFFNDVRVPVENRLGAEGQGWQVTISALANERSSIAEVYGLTRKMEDVKQLARQTRRGGSRAIDIPSVRRRILRAELKIESMRLNGQRFLTKQLKGEPLGSETSINKLHRAALEVELGELAVEINGSAGSLMKGCEEAPDDGSWAQYALGWPEVVIGGGTPNIQKNIIAERILGLPKDSAS
jgi:alkylation response protein AidB-like acyl-CoA dehydrogenase